MSAFIYKLYFTSFLTFSIFLWNAIYSLFRFCSLFFGASQRFPTVPQKEAAKPKEDPLDAAIKQKRKVACWKVVSSVAQEFYANWESYFFPDDANIRIWSKWCCFPGVLPDNICIARVFWRLITMTLAFYQKKRTNRVLGSLPSFSSAWHHHPRWSVACREWHINIHLITPSSSPRTFVCSVLISKLQLEVRPHQIFLSLHVVHLWPSQDLMLFIT